MLPLGLALDLKPKFLDLALALPGAQGLGLAVSDLGLDLVFCGLVNIAALSV